MIYVCSSTSIMTQSVDNHTISHNFFALQRHHCWLALLLSYRAFPHYTMIASASAPHG
jgi:hypothetical protein